MVLVFYFFVNIGFTFSFFKFQKRHIHVLEVFTYWCLSSLLVQNYSAIQTMNYKTSIVPNVVSLGVVHLLNRTVLYPVITLLFLNQYSAATKNWKKAMFIIFYVAFLTGMESLSDFLGVFVHVSWTVWLAGTFWLLYLLILIGFMKYFRRKLFMLGA